MGRKRTQQESGVQAAAEAGTSSENPAMQSPHAELDAGDAPFMTELEMARAELIARNRARMLALGVPLAMDQLSKLTVRAPAAPPRHKFDVHPRHGAEPGPEHPSRKSRRLEEQKEGPKPAMKKEEEEEELQGPATELAEFIISQECPRCGRYISRGHRAHLQSCSGPVQAQPLVMTEEELRAQAQQMAAEEAAKLSELELQGLIDLTPRHALFVVIGAPHRDGTQKHYTIELSDEMRTCGCPDYRYRRHDCKHIRLILTALGCMEHPLHWREAVDRKFLPAGGGSSPGGVQGRTEGAGHGGSGKAGGSGKSKAGGNGKIKGGKRVKKEEAEVEAAPGPASGAGAAVKEEEDQCGGKTGRTGTVQKSPAGMKAEAEEGKASEAATGGKRQKGKSGREKKA